MLYTDIGIYLIEEKCFQFSLCKITCAQLFALSSLNLFNTSCITGKKESESMFIHLEVSRYKVLWAVTPALYC